MRIQDRWYNRIIRDSIRNDKKAGRDITQEPYINSETLLHLQNEQQNKCYYCLCDMQWMERRSSKDGLTVERADNNKAHFISNCSLCCKRCNSRKFSKEKGLLMRYFSKWKGVLNVKQNLSSKRSACYTN